MFVCGYVWCVMCLIGMSMFCGDGVHGAACEFEGDLVSP